MMLFSPALVKAQETIDFTKQGWTNGDTLTLKGVPGNTVDLSFECTAGRNTSGFKGLPTYFEPDGDKITKSCVRLFGRCNIIINAHPGKAITKLEFTFVNKNPVRISENKNTGVKSPNWTVTVDPKDDRPATDDNYKLPGWDFSNNKTWTSSPSSTQVIFGKAPGGGQIDVASIVVYTKDIDYSQKSITLKAQNGSGYWATFSSGQATFFPTGVNVNTVAVDNGTLKLSALSEDEATIDSKAVEGCFVPANTGVLVNADKSTISYYEVYGKTIEDLAGNNMLHPASDKETMNGDYCFYKLAYDDADKKTDLGFYWGADDGAKFDAKEGGAYLAVPKTASAKRVFLLDGNTTGINAINNNKVRANNIYYNLSGQRVDASYKGVVIVNGKKFINK